MSQILCIVDGMTDSHFAAEDYPNLSRMRVADHVDTCRGCRPESLGCISRILGASDVPQTLRGYAEALGAGIPAQPGDLILRGSWFSVDRYGCCTHPVPGPTEIDTGGLCSYYHLEDYKSLLIFPQMDSFIDKIQTHAPYVCAGQPVSQICPTGCPALTAVFWACCGPQRCMIPWGESKAAPLPPFPRRAAVVCGTTVVKGIARLMGMDLLDIPGATGEVDTDLDGKTAAVLAAAQQYPFVLLHINGADEAGHRKNPAEKKEFLLRVDRQVLGPLLASGHEVQVIADHGTDPETGMHQDFLQPLFAK